jgi:hypothetical protein
MVMAIAPRPRSLDCAPKLSVPLEQMRPPWTGRSPSRSANVTGVAGGRSAVILCGAVVSSMRLQRMPLAALTALALLGFLASVGSVPHTHTGAGAGLYNQEHDLSYLAAFGGGAPPPAAAPATPVDAPIVAVPPPAPLRPGSVPRRLARPRAPPAR